MKFIAGLRVWVNGAMGKTPQVFPKIRGSANRRVDLHLPLIASISGRRQCDASKCEMSRLGRDPPSAGRVVIDRKACYLSLLAQAAVWLRELRVSRTFLDNLRLICSVHGYTTRRPANTSRPRSGRFRLRELRESRQISTFTAHLFSLWIPSSARGIDGGP